MLPIKKNVLLAENKSKEITASGIVLEGSGTGESKTATVLAIGSEVLDVVIGNKVLVDWRHAKPVTVDGVQRVVINEEHIIGVIEH